MYPQGRRNPYEDPNYRPPHPTAPFPGGPVPMPFPQDQNGAGPSYYPPIAYGAPLPPSFHYPHPPPFGHAPPHLAPPPHGYPHPPQRGGARAGAEIDPALLADTPLLSVSELPPAGDAVEGEEDPFQDDTRPEAESSEDEGSEDEYYHPGDVSSDDDEPPRRAAPKDAAPPEEVTPTKRGRGRPKGSGKAKAPMAAKTGKPRGRPKKPAPRPPEEEGDEEEGGDGDGEEDEAVLTRLAGFVSRRNAPGQSTAGGVDARHLFDDEIESVMVEETAARGRGKGKRRARNVHKGNYEVQQLVGEANLDYVTGDSETAIAKFLEVIRQDPQVGEAWTGLANCYEEQRNYEAALQMRFCAAHLDGDEGTWRDLAASFKEKGETTQALYCLRKALRSDPNDVMMLLDMVELNRDLGKASRAVELVKKIIKIDSGAAREFVFLAEQYPLFKDTNQSGYFSQVLRAAFDYHIEVFPGPTGDPGNTMQAEHILLLVDMLLVHERLEEALMVVRRGQRWLQGRKEERTWDAYDDDREYDPPGTGRIDNDDEEGDEVEGHQLDFALRHRLALIRLRLGNDSEAAIHIEEILQLDVLQHSALFLALADELFQRKLWDQALNCYATVQECEEIPDDPDVLYHIGICHHQIKDLPQAVETLRWVAETDPSNLEARLRLATVLEEQGHKAEALEIVSAVLRDRAKDPSTSRRGRASTAATADGTSRQTKAELAASRRLQKKVLEDQMLEKMQGLWADAQAAEQGIGEGEPDALERFIYAAGTMIETFRLAKGNFKKDRGVTRIPISKARKAKTHDIDSEAAELHDRLERVMGIEDETPLDDEGGDRFITVRQDSFYEIGAEDWLTLIIKYCAVLMVKKEEDVAMDILEHVLWAGLFNNRRCEIAIRLTTVACGMRLRLYDKVTENCKRLVQMHQFRIDPLLIMNAALSVGGSKAQRQYQNHTLQRFIHRELRIFEQSVRGIRLRWNGQTSRWNEITKVGWSRKLGDVSSGEDEDGDEDGSAAPTPRRGGKGKRGKSADRRAEAEAEAEEEEDDGRYGPTRDIDDQGSVVEAPPLPKPTTASPNFNAVYGQIMLTNGAYQTALVYYLRAYEVDSYNPLICLGTAQAFFGRSFNRQVDNRNYMIAQGMAFLTRYRKLSPTYPEAVEEVEYNFGRAFHGIGVPHLAIGHYERVLSSVEARMNASIEPDVVREESLAPSAAHNLMLLYAASGNTKLVRVKSAWLAL